MQTLKALKKRKLTNINVHCTANLGSASLAKCIMYVGCNDVCMIYVWYYKPLM